jgi:hypothetical protein
MYCGCEKNSYGAYGKQLFAAFIFPKTDKQELTVASFDIITGNRRDVLILCAGAGYDLPVKKSFSRGLMRKKPPLEKDTSGIN